MGKSGGGSNTTTSTSSPPPDVTAQYDKLIAQANDQSAKPLQQYQGQIVAGLNDTQNQAAQQVQNAQGLAQPYYNQAQGLIQQGSQTLNPNTVTAANINQYQNPYTQDVINSTLDNINQQNAGQQQQLIGNAAQQGAWGGDRSAVAQALLANQQDLARNQTIAGLENQSYSQALGEANTQQQQANQAQQASQYLQQQGGFGLLNLGTTAQNQALNSANALNTIGGQQQQQTQEQLNVPYEQFQQAQAFPYQNLSWLSSLSTGLGSNLGGTSTTTQPAPNSSLGLFGLKRGGAVSEGLIKRLAEGGAVMMPPHYDVGGLIPDVSMSYLPGTTTLTRGSGIPAPPKPQEEKSPLAGIEGALGIANSAKGLLGGSGKSSSSSVVPSIGSGTGDAAGSAASSAFSSGATSDFMSGLGDAFMSLFSSFKDGGAIPHGLIKRYDDGGFVSGGLTPFDTSTNPLANNKNSQYAQMPIEQLRELAARIQQPQQKQMIQQVLQQRMAMPNAGQQVTGAPQAPSAPMATMATGGAAKYAFGGNVLPDILSGIGDVVGAWFGDPMAGSQFTGALSKLDGGETKPGLQISSLFKKGGLIKGYDDGGDVTDDIPSPSLANADKSLMDTVAQPVNLIGANDSGMSADNASKMLNLYSDPAPSSGLIKQDNASPDSGYLSNMKSNDATPAPQSDTGFTPVPLPTFHDDKPTNEVNPWLSVLAGVAGAAAGRSPYAIQNIAAGLEGGLKDYSSQKKEAAEEAYKNGTIQDARDNLIREAEQYNSTGQKQATQFQQTLSLDQQKAADEAKYHAADIASKKAELDIKGRQKWTIDPNTGMPMNVFTGELKNPYAGKAAPTPGATGNIASTTPEDYFGNMSPSQIVNYRNSVKKDQPKDIQNQETSLMSLVDQKQKVDDLVQQIPLASSGDIHTLTDFVDRNKIPVFSDPKRAEATVDAAYDSLGNVLDNIKGTFGGTGRVLQAEFNTMKQELNANPAASVEQKAAIVGKIQSRLNQVLNDQMQYTGDIRSGMAYLPNYQSPSAKRIGATLKNEQTQKASSPSAIPPIDQREAGKTMATVKGKPVVWNGSGWDAVGGQGGWQ